MFPLRKISCCFRFCCICLPLPSNVVFLFRSISFISPSLASFLMLPSLLPSLPLYFPLPLSCLPSLPPPFLLSLSLPPNPLPFLPVAVFLRFARWRWRLSLELNNFSIESQPYRSLRSNGSAMRREGLVTQMRTTGVVIQMRTTGRGNDQWRSPHLIFLI